MRRISFIPICIALLAGGCSLIPGGGGPETAESPSPSPAATAEATKPQTFDKPTVAQKVSGTKTIPGLLKTASIPEQVKQAKNLINSAKGRRDPFSILPSQKAAQLPPPPPPDVVANPPFLPPTSTPPTRVRNGGGGDILPPTGPDFTPDFPTGPQPDLARAVAVTGVIKVGNEVQAIVEAPNESTSRYVRAGQRLSNGRVLVKRIEVYEGSEPLVVLEQDGVEVPRKVGETPASLEGEEAAILPPPLHVNRPTTQS